MKKMNRKTLLLLAVVVVLLGTTIGGTVAYLVTNTQPVVNTFKPVKVDIDVREELGDAKENVTIKNTGDIPAYIRAQVIVTWQDADGNVYPVLPTPGTDYTMTFASGTGWIKGSDGFYYYQTPVAAGAETGKLIEKTVSIKANEPEGYDLHVEVLAQAVQAEPTQAVIDLWDVTVSGTTISK